MVFATSTKQLNNHILFIDIVLYIISMCTVRAEFKQLLVLLKNITSNSGV